MAKGTQKALPKAAAGYEVSATVGADGKPVSYQIALGPDALLMQPVDFVAFNKMSADDQMNLMSIDHQAMLNAQSLANAGWSLSDQASNARLMTSCPSGDCGVTQTAAQAVAAVTNGVVQAAKETALVVLDVAGKSAAITADTELGTHTAGSFKPLSGLGQSVSQVGLGQTLSNVVDGLKNLPSEGVDSASKGDVYNTVSAVMTGALLLEGAASLAKVGVGAVKEAGAANTAAAADAAAVRAVKIELNASRDASLDSGIDNVPRVPKTVISDENVFFAPLNAKSNRKASVDANGNANAANPVGATGGGKVAETQATLAQQVADLRATLTGSAKTSGNMGVAQIEIPGVQSTMAASSQVDLPSAAQTSSGFVGKVPETFPSSVVPTGGAKPFALLRDVDSEAKILNNVAAQLGDNTAATGTINLLTERSPCASCSNVIDLFKAKYPNVTVNVFDNNGKLIPPTKKGP